MSTLALLGTYIIITVAAQAYAGPEGLAKNSDDIFASLGTMVLGSTLDKFLIIAVLTSAVASTLTTILPLTRTALSMSVHGAMPPVFAQVNEKYKTPLLNTVIFGVISIAWYVGLTIVSQNILYDSIASLGLMIAFYLGITGYAVPIFYRRTIFKSGKNVVMLFLAPVLGGVILTYIFVKSLIDLYNPANSASGTSWFGIGPPFIIAIAFLVGGVLVMIVSQVLQPSFFHRKLETAETHVADAGRRDLQRLSGADGPAKRRRGALSPPRLREDEHAPATNASAIAGLPHRRPPLAGDEEQQVLRAGRSGPAQVHVEHTYSSVHAPKAQSRGARCHQVRPAR